MRVACAQRRSVLVRRIGPPRGGTVETGS